MLAGVTARVSSYPWYYRREAGSCTGKKPETASNEHDSLSQSTQMFQMSYSKNRDEGILEGKMGNAGTREKEPHLAPDTWNLSMHQINNLEEYPVNNGDHQHKGQRTTKDWGPYSSHGNLLGERILSPHETGWIRSLGCDELIVGEVQNKSCWLMDDDHNGHDNPRSSLLVETAA
jgi:hypothetical protein